MGMTGFKNSIEMYLDNHGTCNNKIAVFYSFQIDNDASGKILSVHGRCHGIEGNCLRALSDIENEWTENRCGNPSLIDLFGDIVRDTASSIYDIQQELNLESLIPKIIAEERFDYTGVFEQVEGEGLDQIDSIIFGDPQLQDIEEKAMREHSSLHQSQRAVIHTIFDHFNLSFNENATECSYDGVNCDRDDVVTNIWLSRRGVSGTIPTSLTQLPKLIGLYLGGNNITGFIPTEFGKMDSLETLWLENNSLTGTIPTEIINMQNLRALNLAQNKLSGALPKFI